jgi:hypothetical protein
LGDDAVDDAGDALEDDFVDSLGDDIGDDIGVVSFIFLFFNGDVISYNAPNDAFKLLSNACF